MFPQDAATGVLPVETDEEQGASTHNEATGARRQALFARDAARELLEAFATRPGEEDEHFFDWHTRMAAMVATHKDRRTFFPALTSGCDMVLR